MKKHYYSYDDVHTASMAIILGMYNDNWRPDYIVGVTRGGLPLALRISNLLDCRMETLKVKLRDTQDDEGCETNCWMSEHAFGYQTDSGNDVINKKNILIVDNIINTGATLNWIKQDWQSSCLPGHPSWNTVWGNNVKFAVMTENIASDFQPVNYSWHEVNQTETPKIYVYPWEN